MGRFLVLLVRRGAASRAQGLGRDDIWGVGLSMSTGMDTQNGFFPFLAAYQAHYVTRDGRLVIDDPEVRQRLMKAIDSYTAIYRKGCTPPDAVNWAASDRNNKAFLAQTVVMTENQTLSIPNALKSERPDDYYENTATIEWPLGPIWRALSDLGGSVMPALVFKDGDHVATAKEFVRFLVGEGWLAHYLNFSGERMLPTMPKLLEAPFWLDPSDPHRMAVVMQVSSRAPQLRLHRDVWATGATTRSGRSSPGGTPSVASSLRASAPSRRSTRRSRASSRFSASS